MTDPFEELDVRDCDHLENGAPSFDIISFALWDNGREEVLDSFNTFIESFFCRRCQEYATYEQGIQLYEKLGLSIPHDGGPNQYLKRYLNNWLSQDEQVVMAREILGRHYAQCITDPEAA